MDPALKAMLHTPVEIAPYTGQDAYGKPTYGLAVTYLGRIEERFQTLPGPVGPILHDLTVVFLAEDAVVDIQSQVTIAGAVRSLQGVKRVDDEWGQVDHLQLFL